MISVFNQTKLPWLLDVENEKVIAFSKQQKYVKDSIEKTAYIKINGTSSILDNIDDTDKKLKSMVNMQDVELLVNKPVNLSFKKKNFKPFITTIDEEKKNILLTSFNLYRSKITKTSGSGVFLLEGLIKANSFNAIISFNTQDAKFSIQIYNITKNQLDTYTFAKVDNMIVKTLVSEEGSDIDIDKIEFRIKIARPSKPTYTVLVSEYDEKAFDEYPGYKKHPNAFNKVVIPATQGALQDIIDNLKSERYSAVTLFVNANKKNEKFYSMVSGKLVSSFAIVFELSSLKGIKKLKLF
jgi:hypothetical protein